MTCDHIPARMRRRPLDARGLPIPFSQFIAADGTPDFRILDMIKVRQCLTQRRCGMCGEIMGKHIHFVGGPLCIHNGLFNDPPMHRDCAVFALTACAHLNRSKGRYNTAAPLPAKAVTSVAQLSSPDKAPFFALLHTTGYKIGRGPEGMIYIHATLPWLDVELWRDGAPIEAPAQDSKTERNERGNSDAIGHAPDPAEER